MSRQAGKTLECMISAHKRNQNSVKRLVNIRNVLSNKLTPQNLAKFSALSTGTKHYGNLAKQKHLQQKMKKSVLVAKRLKDVIKTARAHRRNRVFDIRELMFKGGFPTLMTYSGQNQNVKNRMNAVGFNKRKHVADKWKKIDWAMYHTYNCIRTGVCTNTVFNNKSEPSDIFKFYIGLPLNNLNAIGF